MKKRALTIRDIRDYKASTIPLEGVWRSSIGKPECSGAWIIWGNSANGKTRFALQLAKCLAHYEKVAYDSLEEGLSLSLKEAIEQVGMSDVSRNFVLLDKETLPELEQRLRRQRSPKIVIIDSLQYMSLTDSDYKRLRDRFRSKLFIFVSHADGREPKGAVARGIRYDAFVKIYVEGYKAFPQSRFGGGDEYVIWEHGSRQYWG